MPSRIRLDPKVTIHADVSQIEKIQMELGKGLDTITDLKDVVRATTYKAQAIAVRNVSGVAVTYSKGMFIINRQTGTLARRFRAVFPNVLAGTVLNEAEYASYVNDGHKAVDMKPFLMGKTIRFKPKGKSEYIFRKVTAKSKGWIIPAAKARPFMDATAEQIQPIFAKAVDDVLRAHFEKIMTP